MGDPTGLIAAWINRAEAANTELRHMRKAPALFKPEAVQDALERREAALNQATYWSTIGGGS